VSTYLLAAIEFAIVVLQQGTHVVKEDKFRVDNAAGNFVPKFVPKLLAGTNKAAFNFVLHPGDQATRL
jgi:hypothetical protein